MTRIPWIRTAAAMGLAAVLIASMFLMGACKCGLSDKNSAPPTPAPTAKPSPFVQGPAGKLFVDDGGKGGIPVIFVHGLGCDHTVWAAQVEPLRKTRRVVALDLRGYGQSDPDPKGDYSMEAYAADVAAGAQRLGIPRYVLVGHSMSGLVIAACAAAHPDQVAGLVFDDPAGDLTQIPKKEMEKWLASFAPEGYEAFREKWFGDMLKPARPEVRENVMGLIRKARREVVEASARGLATYDPKPALKAFTGPMLAINTPENNEPYSLHKLQPAMRVVVIEGASHWVMMDKPAEFNAALEEFLKGIPGT
jgi:pimeloyl-ACP methyl ester carboxylesterase